MRAPVQSQAEVIALQPGTLLRDSEGTAYRAMRWRPEWLREERAFLTNFDLDGVHGAVASDQIPFPLYILWEPDAE